MGSSSVLNLHNPGIVFDQGWIDLAPQSASYESAVSSMAPLPADIRLIASLLDLTSLNSDDTDSKILALCEDALQPLPNDRTTVAAVCIYPQFLSCLGTWVKARGIRSATVAGGFPHALGTLDSRCQEINTCAKLADEVDIPIDRRLALQGEWEELYCQTKDLVNAARGTPVKVILATGELPDQQSMYRAATVAMMAGATFVKTSTGKERVNATLEAGAILCRAIKDFERRAGYKVGLKPAGGIRTTREAVAWLQLVRSRLGEEFLTPQYMRFGASTLLDDLRYSMNL